ncbi:PepSY domain-containing protein [Novosphingobium lindaniclasticum]|uniref:PepSY domain-containing protein n=1 Tax=Novosphingobium lindaniclasticum TaxID=1329895 RepID=UPI002409A56B|nr:PepSY domain-containing protein [Novosphingobium lindaniclasticum]
MSNNFRQSQSFLHTWSGLLLGWVLFVIFMAGTIAFWREGLNRAKQSPGRQELVHRDA